MDYCFGSIDMKKLVLFFFLLSGAVVAVMAQGQMSVARFEGQRIMAVDASGVFKIQVRQGGQTKATVNFPKRYENQLVFKMESDGKVVIGFEGTIKGKKGDQFTAEIVCSSLEGIDLSGACSLEAVGDFDARKLEVDLSGASWVVVSGQIRVAENVDLDLSGSTNFKAQIVGRGDVNLEASGASNVNLTGSAGVAHFDLSGASKVNVGIFVVKKAFADVSGASKLEVYATEQLDVEASGASSVIYRGRAKVNVDASGSASVKRGGQTDTAPAAVL